MRTDDEYLQIVDIAFNMFNEQVGTNVSRDNVDICLINADNADNKIAVFLKDFEGNVEPDMLLPGYYKMIRAEAFVTSGRIGILIRTDVEENDYVWRHIVLHEICHIFCTINEIGATERFYQKYCEGYTENIIQEGTINAGYAIWREFIAEYMANLLDNDLFPSYIRNQRNHIYHLLDEIEAMVDDDKYCVSAVLVDVMTTEEIRNAGSFEMVKRALTEYDRLLNSRLWLRMLQLIYEQIQNEDMYKIDVGFIEKIGSVFMNIKTENFILGMRGKDNSEIK